MIISQLEIIEQAKWILSRLSNKQYTHIAKPLFDNSAGAHIRHIIDHYLALMHKQDNLVDYNIRHRFSDVERSVSSAVQQLEEISSWLNNIEESTLNIPLKVLSDISVAKQQGFVTRSTFGRELVFVSQHAVHHFFTLKLILKVQGIDLGAEVGLAPATASFHTTEFTS